MRNITLVTLILIYTLLATNCYAVNDGGTPGYFMNQGMGIKSLGMGKAFVAVCDDFSAMYWNPAGLVKLKKNEIATGYITLFENTKYSYFGFASKLPFNIYSGIGFTQLASDIPEREWTGDIVRTIADYHNLFLVSLGYKLTNNFSLGLSEKFIYNRFDDIESLGYGTDLSFLYSVFKNRLSIGLNIQNILRPVLKKSQGNNIVPINLKTGLSWLLNKNCILAFNIDKSADTSFKFHAGTEYKLGVLNLRAGYDTDNVTAGFGLIYKNYQLDYAIIKHPLDFSHRIGMTFLFGDFKETSTDKSQKEPAEKMVWSEVMEKNYSVTIRTADNIPTAIYDLLEKERFSIINLIIENKCDTPKTLKVVYQIEGNSNEESQTIVVRAKSMTEINCYPNLFPAVIRNIHVHTPAVIKVTVYDIDETGKTEWVAEKTAKTTLNPYDQFCLKMVDAKGIEFDLLKTIVSWITYNDRKLNEVLSKATEQGSMLVPPIKIVGDQPPYIFTKMIDDIRTLSEKDTDYTNQIKLIYNTLKDDYKLSYLNQPIIYRSCQRIKFPAITLKEKGNCIELSILMASLLESIEVEPILVLFLEDGHAAVGWRVKKDDEELYHLIEPNVFGEDFDRLLEKGKELITANDLETEFKQGIPFPEDGIYRKNANIILLDVKKVRNRIPPSPYISQ